MTEFRASEYWRLDEHHWIRIEKCAHTHLNAESDGGCAAFEGTFNFTCC
jgi:hypothetical protein